MKTFVIVNPQAAGGRGLRLWPALADRLFHAIGRFDYEFTNASGVATMLATQAAAQGYGRLIAVGGDGTVNEVLNGLFSPQGDAMGTDLLLGCIPAGSGTDFWKTLGVKEHAHTAIDRLRGKRTRRCDIVRVELSGHDGRLHVRYFCNVADVGLGGEVVTRAKDLPPWGSGFFNYLVASMTAFFAWQPAEMQITIDGRILPPEPLTIALVANGQYCGGGMWIAPAAKLDDGLIDLCCVRPLPKWQFVAMLPKLYSGKLDGASFLYRAQGREIAIEAATPLKVTLDGEVPGQVPARFTVLPKAIRIIV
ncbi:MAG: diacylglycerol kinase family lipid kinase [Deltaproteobacteria bacterium]|nr:diacylglycerol kinase family lipid kinase [Deltaproteobacteria bacterium]